MIVDKRIVEYIKILRETCGSIVKGKIKIILDKYSFKNNIKTDLLINFGKIIKRCPFYLKVEFTIIQNITTEILIKDANVKVNKSLNNLSTIEFIIKYCLKNHPKEIKMYTCV